MINIYSILIIVALLTDALIGFTADVLNLRRLTPELPEEFRDLHDEESYARSQAYTSTNIRFGWVTEVFGLLLLFVFWGSGGFAALHRLVEGPGRHPVLAGIVYIGVLALGYRVLSLPFSIYSTFVIEERFGFNRTSPKTFILDIIKSLLVGAVIGVPLLAAVLFLFELGGDRAWLYGWAVTSVFMLIVQFVAPRWIMPLFNEFRPLEDEGLKARIEKMAAEADFPVKEVFVIDGSRRSSKANAFFAGFGRNRRIALFDTLVENHTAEEIAAVLAHEIGHFRKKHIPLNMAVGVLHAGMLFFLLRIFLDRQGLFEAFHITDGRPVYAGLVFFSLLLHPVEMVLSLLTGLLSRHNEYSADRFAAALTRGEALAEALKKLSRDSLSNLTPHPFFVFLNYSHPPVLERIRRLNPQNHR